ncbi:MAG: PEP-CTERM sorting domain-containing protein, partial [Phycisphaeraceae bacterium]|nr:PEP-CTERM sorting domain-containing protein [Phycisphaeraceae bacterium]
GGNPLLDDQEFTTSYNGNPFKLTIDYNGGVDNNDVILTTTFIPEPASLALLAAGGLMTLPRRRGK